MARGLLVSILACAGCPASALLLHNSSGPDPAPGFPAYTTSPVNQAYPKAAKMVMVLVYGDQWANVGAGPGVLETMFHERNILADIRHVQRHMVGVCSMANEPPAGESLASAIKQAFGELVPHYVWFSGGSHDLFHPHKYMHPIECKLAPLDANKCLKAHVSEEMNYCTDLLLKAMWAVEHYATIKVVQVGYDYPCTDGLCDAASGLSKDKFCNHDKLCRRKNFATFNTYLLGKEWHKGLDDAQKAKYTGLNILGATQSAYPEKYPGVTPGHPDPEMGPPCSDMYYCLWPKKGTKGYKAIAHALWNMYFSNEDLSKFTKSSAAPGAAPDTGK